MTKKKSEPNPIEVAIGGRANPPAKLTTEELQKVAKDVKKEAVKGGSISIPLNPSVIPDEPSPQEMVTLEELNIQTMEKLQEEYPEEPQAGTTPQESVTVPQETTTIPVSKPDRLPVTKTSSLESPPPQKIDKEFHPVAKPIPGIEKLPSDFKVKHTYETGIAGCIPAEDKELTALRNHIMDSGFKASGVAYHIAALCSQPMTTPITSSWDFKDRAYIPEMVTALLKQPGYIEGIWPSLKVIMSDNRGNATWCAGIATTIAFFDVIRTLPALKELQNEKNRN